MEWESFREKSGGQTAGGAGDIPAERAASSGQRTGGTDPRYDVAPTRLNPLPALQHPAKIMSKSGYRDLLVWQKARVLAKDIYLMTRSFPREETFALVQQMRRAAVSILCNIAEGRGRRTRPDYRHFVLMARGSAFELETQIIVAADIGYVAETTAESLAERTTEIARMLNGLLRYIDHASK
ncbi:MAG TPA: four helix bundle protein [Thermoanaerobaculia bacterium]|nr:four helix bundle protein [Thermoanaerobaculia bacterium]